MTWQVSEVDGSEVTTHVVLLLVTPVRLHCLPCSPTHSVCVPVSTACLHVSYHHIYVYISMYAVAAPGGFLGFLETGQTLPAISFYRRT